MENDKLKQRKFEQPKIISLLIIYLFIFILMPIFPNNNNFKRQRTFLPYLIFRLFESLNCLRVNAHLAKSTPEKHSTRIRTCNPNRYSQDRTYEKHFSRTRAFRSRLAVAFLRHIWRRTTWFGTFPVCRPLLYQNLKTDTVIKNILLSNPLIDLITFFVQFSWLWLQVFLIKAHFYLRLFFYSNK